MHSDQLRYLIEVSRAGSINAAAQNLFMAPSSLSMSLQKLEHELGMPLLNRTQKGVTLTDAGAQTLKVAQNFLGDIAKIMRDHNMVANSAMAGDVSLLLPYSMLNQMIAAFICEFYQDFPAISVKVKESEIFEICRLLDEEIFELALVYYDHTMFVEDNILEKCHLHYYPLFPCKLVVEAGLSHPISAYKSLSIARIEDYPILIFNPPDCNEADNALPKFLATCHIRPQKIIFESSLDLMSEMLSAGLGISINVSSPIARFRPRYYKRVVQIPLQKNIFSSFGYLVKIDKNLSLPATIFLNELITYISYKGGHESI